MSDARRKKRQPGGDHAQGRGPGGARGAGGDASQRRGPRDAPQGSSRDGERSAPQRARHSPPPSSGRAGHDGRSGRAPRGPSHDDAQSGPPAAAHGAPVQTIVGSRDRPWSRIGDDRPVALPAAFEKAFAAFFAERFPKARGARLVAEIEALSDAFTAEREELPGSYLNRPEARSAYLAFFHPQQVLRAMSALAEVRDRAGPRGLLPKRDVVRIADLGAGLGAMSQAALAVGAFPAARHEFTLVDHQRSAVADARELLLRCAAPEPVAAPATTDPAAPVAPTAAPVPAAPVLVRTAVERLELWVKRALHFGWRYDVILLGGVWNELETEWEPLFAKILELLDPAAPGGGIVVSMEPALPPFARRLAALHDAFTDRTTTIAPCTHGDVCPLSAFRKDWCFTVRPAKFPAQVETWAAHLGHQSREVRYAFWAAAGRADAAPPEIPAAKQGRIISDPMPGGQLVCAEGEKRRMPERAPPLRRGVLVAERAADSAPPRR